MNSCSLVDPLMRVSSGTPYGLWASLFTQVPWSHTCSGLYVFCWCPVSGLTVQCRVGGMGPGSVSAQIWAQTWFLHCVTFNKLPDLCEPLSSSVTSFEKSVSRTLQIQLHEMKDCFLSYKCNEIRIRVEWRMAGSPSLPAEFYPVCMMAIRQAIDNLSSDILVW